MWAPIKCVNHPERDAVAQCDECGVPICSACVRIYEYAIDPVNKKRKNLCSECEDDQTQAAAFFRKVLYLFVVVGFIIVLFVSLNNFGF